MTEFVGRTGSKRVYSYPETAKRGSTLALARNFATGPKTATAITVAGVQIPWNAIDVGTAPSPDVPITPRSTGIVLISAVIALANTSGGALFVTAQVQIDGVSMPVPNQSTTVPAGGTIAMPILAETIAADTPPGTTKNIQIIVFAQSDGSLFLSESTSALSIQEVVPATG